MSKITGLSRTELLRRLLAGESLDTSRLGYDLGGQHLGVIAADPQAEASIRRIGEDLERPLLIYGGEEQVCGWWGGRREFQKDELDAIADLVAACGAPMTIGEPAEGTTGWRLTYRQAQAAQEIALRDVRAFTRYREVALLASLSRDKDLLGFLEETFVIPLEGGSCGTPALATTLRAYLDAHCRPSSAAMALGLTRRALMARLDKIEEEIGRPLVDCMAELDLALRLGALGA